MEGLLATPSADLASFATLSAYSFQYAGERWAWRYFPKISPFGVFVPPNGELSPFAFDGPFWWDLAGSTSSLYMCRNQPPQKTISFLCLSPFPPPPQKCGNERGNKLITYLRHGLLFLSPSIPTASARSSAAPSTGSESTSSFISCLPSAPLMMDRDVQTWLSFSESRHHWLSSSAWPRIGLLSFGGLVFSARIERILRSMVMRMDAIYFVCCSRTGVRLRRSIVVVVSASREGSGVVWVVRGGVVDRQGFHCRLHGTGWKE